MREQPQDDPQEPGCCCCWNLPLSHSPWDLPGSSCSRCSPNMWNIRAPELLGRQSGFHGDFPPLKSVWGLFISRRCFCYNKSACFTCPEIFPWEISLLALCSPACLGFYLALLAIVLFIRGTDFLFFFKNKNSVFLFTLQLNAESESSAGGSPVLWNGNCTCNSCCDYFELYLLGPWRDFPADVSMEGREWCWGKYKHWSAWISFMQFPSPAFPVCLLNANACENPEGSYIHRISVCYSQRRKKKIHWSECLPWEIYFLPNITDSF